jgi:hypothetical protein
MITCQIPSISREPLLAALLFIFCFTFSVEKTSLEKASTDLAANPAELTEKDFSEFIGLRFTMGSLAFSAKKHEAR